MFEEAWWLLALTATPLGSALRRGQGPWKCLFIPQVSRQTGGLAALPFSPLEMFSGPRTDSTPPGATNTLHCPFGIYILSEPGGDSI